MSQDTCFAFLCAVKNLAWSRKRETLVTEPLEVDGFPLDDQNTTRLGAGFYQDPLQPLLTQQVPLHIFGSYESKKVITSSKITS